MPLTCLPLMWLCLKCYRTSALPGNSYTNRPITLWPQPSSKAKPKRVSNSGAMGQVTRRGAEIPDSSHGTNVIHPPEVSHRFRRVSVLVSMCLHSCSHGNSSVDVLESFRRVALLFHETAFASVRQEALLYKSTPHRHCLLPPHSTSLV